MLLALTLLTATLQSGGAVELGAERLRRALAQQNLGERIVDVRVSGAGAPESFRITRDGERLVVEGADASGAMYGAYEAAELVERDGEDAWTGATLAGAPHLESRGLNVFLTLPWDSDANEPIYDPAALGDPERWWFQSDDYWRTLFDLMAEARLNWLDLHGAYDIQTTRFPNLYAYFVESSSFPEVGVSRELKQKNLAQLARVIAMAHARGVRVSLMSYEARFDTPHREKPPYEASEENLYRYTREVVEATIRALPELDAIGFRIGESGHGGEFFRCYQEAVAASGRDIPLITRSWITRKRKVVELARASSDFTVEIKYNGEQWGPPYMIAGGRVPGWHSYSFEDYLSDSNVESAARMWPGNVAENGETWPAEPYRIVWQVRANGTHRIFPFYEPDWVRRTIGCMKIGTARGFTVEPLNAYYPATPRYYLADPKDQWCDWIHQRDAIYLIQWGRLGYDLETPESVFEEQIERHYGYEVGVLAPQWKAASRIVPLTFCNYSLGPDHRDHAPELEWGGTAEDFIQGEPFDTHVIAPTRVTAAIDATRGSDPRVRASAVLELILRLTFAAAGRVPDWPPQQLSAAAREVDAATIQLASLGAYHFNRLFLALSEATQPPIVGQDVPPNWRWPWWREALMDWMRISRSPAAAYYKPFPDRLRMRSNHFHWMDQVSAVTGEAAKFAPAPEDVGIELEVRSQPCCKAPEFHSRGPQPSWSAEADDVLVARVPSKVVIEALTGATERVGTVRRAWLLEKPLPSSTFFHRREMAQDENGFVVRLPRNAAGHLIAFGVQTDRGGGLLPDWRVQTPYLVVPSRIGPTPLYYSSQEALTYLKPATLDPAKQGMLFVGSRAWDFHRGFDVAVQRKLLDAVARGMLLVVLQQDYASGRYSRDWFPHRPEIADARTDVFDPAGVLGLERVETPDVLWQPILPSAGWDVFGNGGIARTRCGKGEIWLCQARLIQRMHIPGCARNLKRLLELGGREKPVVIVDAGSEGNRYSTSVFPDFMNAHDIPFLTLGEVIASEQDMDSVTPVPGVASADRVLEGRGGQMVADLVAAKMRAACGRPVPATREEFEVERARRKREFLRTLGLDPSPERTPLDARVVGRIERDGYTIDKVVFESRPDFPVTAHLYLPANRAGERLPVIVNPHGHWSHKKSEPVVQARAIAQALAGYAAFVVDSPGFSFEEDARIERRRAGTHFDPKLIIGSTTANAIYAWDLMRAVDYLETRPECDTTRVGITGTSGGGHATLSAFAADERFDCAVPVCYATSFLDGWDNGCDCNHLPGYVQTGDRADVLAIRAPAPVFVIGARIDAEFPPEGTQHTGEKLAATWKLFGAEERARWQVFDGEHDYSKAMREAALGFFDLHLRGRGDGSPVPEPELDIAEPEADELFCLPEVPLEQLTMRDVARANANRAPRANWEMYAELNGGLPERADLGWRVLGRDLAEPRELATFESELGLTIPCLLRLPAQPKAAIVFVHEEGKLGAERDFPVAELSAQGFATLCLDARGTGELAGLDPKLMSYLGTAQFFAMGWDAARAAEAMLALTPRVAVVGRGPAGSLAALVAGHCEPRVALVVGLDALERWDEALTDDVPLAAVQPRAGYAPSIERLRKLYGRELVWYPRDRVSVDVAALLAARLAR